MRRSSLVLALLLIACNQTRDAEPGKSAAQTDKAPTAAEPEPELETEGEPSGVKAHGNLPVKTEAEPADEAIARAQCVASCVEANVAEAKPADAIEADCQAKCQPGPAQVEVRPY